MNKKILKYRTQRYVRKHHDALDKIARTKGIKVLSDWYNMPCSLGSAGLSFSQYLSLPDALRTVYPEYDWHNWEWARKSKYANSDDLRYRREVFDSMGERLGVKDLDGWIKVPKQAMYENGGRFILDRYNRSKLRTLEALYPKRKWLLLLEAPRHKYVFDRIAEQLAIKDFDSWFDVSHKEVYQSGAAGLLNKFKEPLEDILRAVYPEPASAKPRWRIKMPVLDSATVVEHLNNAASVVGIKVMNDWYGKTWTQLSKCSGIASIRSQHKMPLAYLVERVYPNHDWDPSQFRFVPRAVLTDKDIELNKLNVIGERLRIKHLDQWYNFTKNALQWTDRGILGGFRGSYADALMRTFPSHDWQPWKFSTRPAGFWESRDNQLAFLQFAQKKFGLANNDMWYRVSTHQLFKLGGTGILHHYPQALQLLDNNFVWEWHKFPLINKRAKQRVLLEKTKQLMPGKTIEEEHFIGVRESNGTALSVDIFVAELSIGIEYQGEHHFTTVYKHALPLTVYEARDAVKLQQCKDNGITLVLIPYWWDGTIETLGATIKYHRPDVELARTVRWHDVPPLRMQSTNIAQQRNGPGLMSPGDA